MVTKKKLIFQVGKYVRFEKKLPPSDMDELMDLRESWESPGSASEKNEELIEKLKKDLESANKSLEAEKENVAKLESQIKTDAKVQSIAQIWFLPLNHHFQAAVIENSLQEGQIYTYQERLKQTEENNAELRKILRRYSKGDKLTKSPFAKLES